MDSSSDLTIFIELTNNVTDAFTMALYFVDPVNNTLHLKEHLTLSDNLDKEAIISIGEGPVGIAASDKIASLNEFSQDNQPNLPMYKTMEDLKGLMAVPVMNG